MELDHFAQDANEMPHVLDTHVLHDRVHVLVAQTSALGSEALALFGEAYRHGAVIAACAVPLDEALLPRVLNVWDNALGVVCVSSATRPGLTSSHVC